MKRRLTIILAVVIIVVIVISAFAAIQSLTPPATNNPTAEKKPFYVGITYGGSSVTEAEQLIDKVKGYTNLFMVQSNYMQYNLTAMEQVCGYAVNAGLNVITYFGSYPYQQAAASSFLTTAQTSWGSHFLGLYYGDEPGGKTLDSTVNLENVPGIGNVTKNQYDIEVSQTNNSIFNSTAFYFSGQITVEYNSVGYQNQTEYFPNGTIEYFANNLALIYLPNGTVESLQNNEVMTLEPNGTTGTTQPQTAWPSYSQFESYQKLWDSRPFQTANDSALAAEGYVTAQQDTIGWIHSQLPSAGIFTSDYGLYWYDYQAGYNAVFTEVFGGQLDEQAMAMARGAADMQGKGWGVMIEWASQSPVTLQSGDQIYNELEQAYKDGAEYAVVFNYAPTNGGAGPLQDDQFAAIQRFWSDVVKNPHVTNDVEGQDALVLPNSCGWGMRSQNDTVWGLWQPDSSCQQIWSSVQASLAQYGSKLDIIYDDPAYPSAGQYQHVYYWNQTM